MRSADGNVAQIFSFQTLVSANGFTKTAYITLLLSQKEEGGAIRQDSLRQSYDYSEYADPDQEEEGREPSIQIGNSLLSATHSHGELRSKGIEASWNLKWEPLEGMESSPFHSWILSRIKGIQEVATLTHPSLILSGTSGFMDRKFDWKDAKAAIFRRRGGKTPKLSTWLCAPGLSSDDGKSLSISGFSCMDGPSFRIRYADQVFWFRGLFSAFHTHSEEDLTTWTFSCERRDLVFRGSLKAQTKHFHGWTHENTNGSLYFTSIDLFAKVSIQVYRAGHLEKSFQGDAFFEHRSWDRNEYVLFSP